MQELQGTWVRSLDQEDSLEEEMATHSSTLAWKIPWTRGAWQATDHEVSKSRTWLSSRAHTHAKALSGISLLTWKSRTLSCGTGAYRLIRGIEPGTQRAALYKAKWVWGAESLLNQMIRRVSKRRKWYLNWDFWRAGRIATDGVCFRKKGLQKQRCLENKGTWFQQWA